MSDHSIITRFIPELIQKYDVLIWDFPGQGNSRTTNVKEIGDPSILAKSLYHILEYLNIQNLNLYAVGISSGGYTILEMAVVYPNLFKKIILSGTILHFNYSSYYRVLSYKELLKHKHLDLLVLRMYSDLYSHNFLSSIQGMIQNFTENIKKRYSENCTLISHFYEWKANFFMNLKFYQTKYETIKNPILYIYGSQDALFELNQKDMEEMIINSPLFYPIQNTGHYPLTEKPKDFFSAIYKFLQ